MCFSDLIELYIRLYQQLTLGVPREQYAAVLKQLKEITSFRIRVVMPFMMVWLVVAIIHDYFNVDSNNLTQYYADLYIHYNAIIGIFLLVTFFLLGSKNKILVRAHDHIVDIVLFSLMIWTGLNTAIDHVVYNAGVTIIVAVFIFSSTLHIRSKKLLLLFSTALLVTYLNSLRFDHSGVMFANYGLIDGSLIFFAFIVNRLLYVNQVRNMMIKEQLEKVNQHLTQEITEREKAERKLTRVQLEIEKSLESEIEMNSLKRKFIEMISHQYRTPLTIIQSSTYILDTILQNYNNPKVFNHLSKIRRSIADLVKLLNDVIEIEKYDDKNLEIFPQDISLEKLIRDEVAELKGNNGNANVYIIKFEEKLIIQTDEILLKRIVRNILNNAVKFSDEKSTIEISACKKYEQVQISVSDFGIGIPLEDQNNIFNPFFKASNAGIMAGAGLGLAIAWKASKSINATLEVHSIIDERTTINLILPNRL